MPTASTNTPASPPPAAISTTGNQQRVTKKPGLSASLRGNKGHRGGGGNKGNGGGGHKGGHKGLTKHQRQKLLNSLPLVPGGSMTVGQANQSANAAVKAQYAPQFGQLAQTRRNVEAWFPQYQQELSALNNSAQQQYVQATNQINQQAAASQQQQSQSNLALQQGLQADAAKRGATYSGRRPPSLSRQRTSARTLRTRSLPR
jgi:hypothetical protein